MEDFPYFRMSSYLSISTDLNQLLTAHLKAEGIVIKGTWSILKVQCVMGLWHPTVDGNQKSGKFTSWGRLVVYPIIYGVLHIPGGWPWDFWTINSMTLLPVNLVMVCQISVCESPDSASRRGTRWTSEKLQRHETGTIATIIQQASSNHWKTIQLQHFISKPWKVLFFVKIIFKTLHQHLCLSTCHQIFHRKKNPSPGFHSQIIHDSKTNPQILCSPGSPGGWSHGHPYWRPRWSSRSRSSRLCRPQRSKRSGCFQSDSKIDPLVN